MLRALDTRGRVVLLRRAVVTVRPLASSHGFFSLIIHAAPILFGDCRNSEARINCAARLSAFHISRHPVPNRAEFSEPLRLLISTT